MNLRTIGERLRKIREERGLTVNEVGRAIGKSKSTIYGYEDGSRGISLATFFSMCDLYCVVPGQLSIKDKECIDISDFSQDSKNEINAIVAKEVDKKLRKEYQNKK